MSDRVELERQERNARMNLAAIRWLMMIKTDRDLISILVDAMTKKGRS